MAARQRFRKFAAHVAPRFSQFFQDVLDRRFAGIEDGGQFRCRVHLYLIAQAGQLVRVLQVFMGQAVMAGDFFGQSVRFGMDRRIIQGLAAVFNAQETGALHEGRRAQAGDVEQVLPVLERTVFIAVGDDVRSRCRRQAGNVLQ